MRNQRGITLITLIITIVVMTIIAGITIKLSVSKDDGLIVMAENVANEAKDIENSSQTKRDELYQEMISPNN